MKAVERYLDRNQKHSECHHFTEIQATDYSFTHKEWTALRQGTSQD